MPNIASAKKRLRQNIKRRDRNRKAKATLRTLLRKTELAIDAGENKDEALALLKESNRRLDKIAQKKIIHKNMAGRKKSRLTAKFNKQFA